VNSASNDEESTYTELNKIRDVEDNYQSLTWVEPAIILCID
jgi:hypothetical protein